MPTSEEPMERLGSPEATMSGGSLHVVRALCLELRRVLERSRHLLDEEIRTHPTPIPRCDAQFNHIYERRSRLAEQLERMRRVDDGMTVPGALVGLITGVFTSARCTENAEEQALRAQLAAELAKLELPNPAASGR